MRKLVILMALVIAFAAGPARAHVRPETNLARHHIVNRTDDRLGAGYCWGGTRRCYDCSGLTLRVFREHGAWLPHSTRRQWRARDRDGWLTLQRLSELRRGDLVFFKNTYRDGISHVGIYVGKRTFIHAGDRVEKSSFDTRYWRRHFAAGVRPSSLTA